MPRQLGIAWTRLSSSDYQNSVARLKTWSERRILHPDDHRLNMAVDNALTKQTGDRESWRRLDAKTIAPLWHSASPRTGPPRQTGPGHRARRPCIVAFVTVTTTMRRGANDAMTDWLAAEPYERETSTMPAPTRPDRCAAIRRRSRTAQHAIPRFFGRALRPAALRTCRLSCTGRTCRRRNSPACCASPNPIRHGGIRR